MTVSDVLERVLADVRRRLGDDPDPAAIREAVAEAARDESDQSLEERDVDAVVTAYREQFVDGTSDDVPADHTEAAAVDDAGMTDHTEETPLSEGVDDADADADDRTDRSRGSVRKEPRRINRVAHFRDSVRTAGEWTETAGRIGPGVFDVASEAQTTGGMDDQLAAQFDDVDYEVRSYTLGPDDRHPSWTQIRLSESFDPSTLPEDVTIRKVEDAP